MRLFVFPLDNIVLYPSSTLPLNIFEPRYIQMVNDALELKIPIALTYLDPTDPEDAKSIQSFSGKLVTGAGQPILFEKRENQTMVIFVKGEGRYQIQSVVQEKPYIICEAEKLEDHREIRDENKFFLNRLKNSVTEWLDQNVRDAEQRGIILSQTHDPWTLIEIFSTSRLPDPDARQSLLELSDINERIALLKKLI